MWVYGSPFTPRFSGCQVSCEATPHHGPAGKAANHPSPPCCTSTDHQGWYKTHRGGSGLECGTQKVSAFTPKAASPLPSVKTPSSHLDTGPHRSFHPFWSPLYPLATAGVNPSSLFITSSNFLTIQTTSGGITDFQLPPPCQIIICNYHPDLKKKAS